MLDIITKNLGSISVAIVLITIVIAIVLKIIRDTRKGKCFGCNLDCTTCANKQTSANDTSYIKSPVSETRNN